MSLNSIREKINLSLYESKNNVLNLFKYLSFIISCIILSLFIYQYGYNLENDVKALIFKGIKGSFVFYIIKYLIDILYSYKPLNLIKQTWFECILLSLIVINSLSGALLDQSLFNELGSLFKIKDLANYYSLFIQFYFFLIIGIEITKANTIISGIKLSPPQLLIMSFILLIVIGTALLMMPEMTHQNNKISYFEALFTSISASCVTGLVVVDTASYFTQKGHTILMILIQLGGLNIISFATLFTIFSRKGMGIRHQSILHENLSSESLFSSKGLIGKIFFISILIEVLGAFLLYFYWNEIENNQIKNRLFYSIFHSVSAFNNAGFSLFTDGLNNTFLSKSFNIHIIIAGLIFMGGIGFPVISEIFDLKRVISTLKNPWKKLKLSTQISFYTSLFLVVFGALMFYFLEQQNSLNGMSMKGQFFTSIFQSITARTAGFNTVDFGSIGLPMIIIFIFLMFIGASPGSTGGGIKTSTFMLIIFSGINTIKGNKKIEISGRTISPEILHKAFSIFLFSTAFIFLSIFILTITDENLGILPLTFETISAFSTVGLTTGITTDLSILGKVVIMINMFAGRIGTLTLAFALSSKVKTNNYKFPNAHITIV